ncbi:hypothetical protein OPQ81_000079 [Rhizoctonia solani]|nr:hypothetical protein OPQ81_000079 [Rhizoctonia solani]
MSVCDQQAATSERRRPSFSSPLLQTPKQLSGHHFDETSGRTPRFAEEYSVFNSTPGNFRRVSSPGSDDVSNPDFVPESPVVAPSTTGTTTGRKRPLSAQVVAVEIAAHANHFTADPVNLAPVDPAPAAAIVVWCRDKNKSSAQQQGRRLAKKPRRASVSGTAPRSPPAPAQGHQQTQTATPPPSSRGGRKLAPKPQMDNMQDQGNPEDVFSYQVGPATAPPITGPRPFWGLDMDASGMHSGGALAIDVDLSAAGADIFQTGSVQNHAHGQMDSMDWGSADQMFQQQQQQQQEMAVPADQQTHYRQQSSRGSNVQQQHVTPRRERALAPKTASMSTPGLSQESPSQSFLGSFQMMDNPFSASPGGVDPDHGTMSMSMDTITSQHPTSSAPAVMTAEPRVTESTVRADNKTDNSAPPAGGGQEASKGQQQRKKLGRAPAISSAKKSDGRPNLSRSFSESARGGKRTVGGGRNPLPVLAPARPVTNRQPNLPSQAANSSSNSSRAQMAAGGRPGGRSSPLKSSHHHRLSSLTSIPENTANLPPRPSSAKRTSVKFVIDENGRAHAETVVDGEGAGDDEQTLELDPLATSSQQFGQRSSWSNFLRLSATSPVSDDDYSSSSDDEPIIIPSRNPSFAFPDPRRGSSSGNPRPPTASSSSSNIFAQARIQRRSFSDRPSMNSFRRDEADTTGDVEPPPPVLAAIATALHRREPE